MKSLLNLRHQTVLCAAILLGLGFLFAWQKFSVSANDLYQKNFVKHEGNVKNADDSTVFAEFDNWTQQYIDKNFTVDKLKLDLGEKLAIKRKELIKNLAQSDPKAAFDKLHFAKTYDRLPLEVTEHLEKHISGSGDFVVSIFDKIDSETGKITGSQIERKVCINKSCYKAFVYGRRETMTTKLNIPLQGFIIDDMMIVDESPVRTIEAAEYESFGIDSAKLGTSGVAAEVGGSKTYFSSRQELENFVRDEVTWESKIGPERSGKNLAPEQVASPWTMGLKKVLLIRVDFPDRPGEPIDINNQPLTEKRAQDLFNNEINPFYIDNSYNKTSLQATVTSVVRLPQPQTFYTKDENAGAMHIDAENAARAAGFESDDYDLEVITFSWTKDIFYGGLGTVGGKISYINGYFDLYVIGHELGHNYGLFHANSWRAEGESPIGPGSHLEYGDVFDIMGAWTEPFNARYKRLLNWLTDDNVQNVTTNGTYRIFAQDDSSSASGIRTLKIRKNNARNYWIEFRKQVKIKPDAANAAMIRWDSADNTTEILDMVPATPFSVFDAPLLIGQSFFDGENRIRITIVGKGNTTPESLDVKVELNIGCSFTLTQKTGNISASGGEGVINVNTETGCSPTVTSNDSWIYAVPADSGVVNYLIQANYGSQPRTGTITIAGQTFTIQQEAAATACVPRPPNLVAWWRGEGNTLDETGSNDGINISNMIFAGGKIGGGFKDTGFSKIQIPDSASLALNRSMTFEGWLKLDSYGGKIIERIKETAGIPVNSYQIMTLPSGQLLFNIFYDANNTGTGIISAAPLPLNQFFHFAASLDDATGQMKLYVNGSLIRQSTISQRPNTIPGAQVNIGGLNGIIDELSVYNRALSASEIQSIYNAGTAVTGAAGKCVEQSAAAQTTIETNPAGLSIIVDGTTYTSTQTFTWQPGSSHTIATISPQGDANTRYTWNSWSDSGATSHTIIAPLSGTIYTANFIVQYFLTMNAGTGGAVTPQSNWYNAGQNVSITAVPNSGNTFLNWIGNGSGAYTGTKNPTIITMNAPITEAANFSESRTHSRKTVGVFRPSNGITYMRNSNTGGNADINMVYGIAGDQSFAGDWNGDHIDSMGIYRDGIFYLRNSNTTGPADIVFAFGSPGDQPVDGDWNGDGIDTIGVYRPSTGVFMLRNSNSAGPPDVTFVLGNPGDIAIAGDWNGDGVTTTGVFRPTNGIVYLKNTNTGGNADINLVYGIAGDTPVAGDWDGDGIDSIGIYRDGVFYLRNSNTQGVADFVFALGNSGDKPIAGDWDGLP